jgi:hypothetical protein
MNKDNELDLQIKCNTCDIVKPQYHFYKCVNCKKCNINSYIHNNLIKARIANHLNLSITMLNDIITNDLNDPTRNELGEHKRYNEVILLMTNNTLSSSTVITDDIIDSFLDVNI